MSGDGCGGVGGRYYRVSAPDGVYVCALPSTAPSPSTVHRKGNALLPADSLVIADKRVELHGNTFVSVQVRHVPLRCGGATRGVFGGRGWALVHCVAKQLGFVTAGAVIATAALAPRKRPAKQSGW